MNAVKQPNGVWTRNRITTQFQRPKIKTEQQFALSNQYRQTHVPFALTAQEFDITPMFDIDQVNKSWAMKPEFSQKYDLIKDGKGNVIAISMKPETYTAEKNGQSKAKDSYIPHIMNWLDTGLLSSEERMGLYKPIDKETYGIRSYENRPYQTLFREWWTDPTQKKGYQALRTVRESSKFDKDYVKHNSGNWSKEQDIYVKKNAQYRPTGAIKSEESYKDYLAYHQDDAGKVIKKELVMPDQNKTFDDTGRITSLDKWDDYVSKNVRFKDGFMKERDVIKKLSQVYSYKDVPDQEMTEVSTQTTKFHVPNMPLSHTKLTRKQYENEVKYADEIRKANTIEKMVEVSRKYGKSLEIKIPFTNKTIKGDNLQEIMDKYNNYIKNESQPDRVKRYITMLSSGANLKDVKELVFSENPSFMVQYLNRNEQGRKALIKKGIFTGLINEKGQFTKFTKEQERVFIKHGPDAFKQEVPLMQVPINNAKSEYNQQGYVNKFEDKRSLAEKVLSNLNTGVNDAITKVFGNKANYDRIIGQDEYSRINTKDIDEYEKHIKDYVESYEPKNQKDKLKLYSLSLGAHKPLLAAGEFATDVSNTIGRWVDTLGVGKTIDKAREFLKEEHYLNEKKIKEYENNYQFEIDVAEHNLKEQLAKLEDVKNKVLPINNDNIGILNNETQRYNDLYNTYVAKRIDLLDFKQNTAQTRHEKDILENEKRQLRNQAPVRINDAFDMSKVLSRPADDIDMYKDTLIGYTSQKTRPGDNLNKESDAQKYYKEYFDYNLKQRDGKYLENTPLSMINYNVAPGLVVKNLYDMFKKPLNWHPTGMVVGMGKDALDTKGQSLKDMVKYAAMNPVQAAVETEIITGGHNTLRPIIRLGKKVKKFADQKAYERKINKILGDKTKLPVISRKRIQDLIKQANSKELSLEIAQRPVDSVVAGEAMARLKDGMYSKKGFARFKLGDLQYVNINDIPDLPLILLDGKMHTEMMLGERATISGSPKPRELTTPTGKYLSKTEPFRKVVPKDKFLAEIQENLYRIESENNRARTNRVEWKDDYIDLKMDEYGLAEPNSQLYRHNKLLQAKLDMVGMPEKNMARDIVPVKKPGKKEYSFDFSNYITDQSSKMLEGKSVEYYPSTYGTGTRLMMYAGVKPVTLAEFWAPKQGVTPPKVYAPMTKAQMLAALTDMKESVSASEQKLKDLQRKQNQEWKGYDMLKEFAGSDSKYINRIIKNIKPGQYKASPSPDQLVANLQKMKDNARDYQKHRKDFVSQVTNIKDNIQDKNRNDWKGYDTLKKMQSIKESLLKQAIRESKAYQQYLKSSEASRTNKSLSKRLRRQALNNERHWGGITTLEAIKKKQQQLLNRAKSESEAQLGKIKKKEDERQRRIKKKKENKNKRNSDTDWDGLNTLEEMNSRKKKPVKKIYTGTKNHENKESPGTEPGKDNEQRNGLYTVLENPELVQEAIAAEQAKTQKQPEKPNDKNKKKEQEQNKISEGSQKTSKNTQATSEYYSKGESEQTYSQSNQHPWIKPHTQSMSKMKFDLVTQASAKIAQLMKQNNKSVSKQDYAQMQSILYNQLVKQAADQTPINKLAEDIQSDLAELLNQEQAQWQQFLQQYYYEKYPWFSDKPHKNRPIPPEYGNEASRSNKRKEYNAKYSTSLSRMQDPFYRITGKNKYSNLMNLMLRERYGNAYS